MTAKELMDKFFARSAKLDDRTVRLLFRLLLHHIADHWYELRLMTGESMMHADSTDASLALRECGEAALIPDPEQPRWKVTCVKCFHVHEQGDCCGVDLGKGGVCECKAEVVA